MLGLIVMFIAFLGSESKSIFGWYQPEE
ncbi:cyclic lactone autoinducer peptide [Anaerorhabdus sp.]